MNVFFFLLFLKYINVVNVVVGADLCSPCDTSITSCDSNYVCNPATYRCECPTDHVQYGDDCCKCLFIYLILLYPLLHKAKWWLYRIHTLVILSHCVRPATKASFCPVNKSNLFLWNLKEIFIVYKVIPSYSYAPLRRRGGILFY